MKSVYQILLFCLATLQCFGQNHVSNGGFEDYSSCPATMGELTKCTGWAPYHNGTTDYYRTCGGVLVDVPYNYAGYQPAAEGQAYIGLVTYESSNAIFFNYKEYAVTQIVPLRKNYVYQVGMYVSLGGNSIHACNDLGAYFFNTDPGYTASDRVLPVKPQISYANYGVIKDTQNWVWLSKTFVADSAYRYMVIGGFDDYSVLKRDSVRHGSGNPSAYFLIDSVVVVAIDSIDVPPDTSKNNDVLVLDVADNSLCLGDSLYVSYTAGNNSSFTAGNIFTLQISADTHTFRNPLTLGHTEPGSRAGTIAGLIPLNLTAGYYRVRIISSDPAWAFAGAGLLRIIRRPELKLTDKIEVCVGEDIALKARASLNSAITWKGPVSFRATVGDTIIKQAHGSQDGLYIATADNAGCIVTDTTVVHVGCHTISVPSGFSPNGDGKNDMLYFFSTGDLSAFHIVIYNRWGQAVFNTSDISKGWDGGFNGNQQEMDTYAYVVKATFKDGAVYETKGNVTLIR